MTKQKTKKGNKSRDLPTTTVRKINPNGATVLVNLPKSKKKVGLYGLI